MFPVCRTDRGGYRTQHEYRAQLWLCLPHGCSLLMLQPWLHWQKWKAESVFHMAKVSLPKDLDSSWHNLPLHFNWGETVTAETITWKYKFQRLYDSWRDREENRWKGVSRNTKMHILYEKLEYQLPALHEYILYWKDFGGWGCWFWGVFLLLSWGF